MEFKQLVERAAGLTAAQWDLYADAADVEAAASAMNEGLVQALHKPTQAQAWAYMEMFMERFMRQGAMDTEPRALIRSLFEEVRWDEKRGADVREWDAMAYVSVTGCASEEDDEGVQGIYPFEISTEEDVDLARPGHVTAVAKAVLDCFHAHQGIDCLDDFEITVLLSDGTPIAEEDATEPEIEVTTEHCGSMDESDAPVPVWHHFHSEQTRLAKEQMASAERGS